MTPACLPASSGAFGAQLNKLLGSGGVEGLMLLSHSIDGPWLLNHAPAIRDAKKLIIVTNSCDDKCLSRHILHNLSLDAGSQAGL